MNFEPFPAREFAPPRPRARNVIGVSAVLGPTNTGKTHLALERMLAHPTGMIGLPLRLLAREVYNKLVDRAGKDAVALITGEEKIKPKSPRYWVSTVEAMPRDIDVSFLAIDEIQLCADADRGHIFTDALLNRRGLVETMLIGSSTMRPLVEMLLPGIQIITRPRLSTLTYAGEKKITRMPGRSAIVAFSAEDVYTIAELVRRERGGAAVVLGALSPRTRNAQVALFQNGEVDHIVATDAIGLGLNLDIDHVAFASNRKFDGHSFRKLNAAELGQIAGRAGRALRDGTFGTTGRCPQFEPELIENLEAHQFEPLRLLNWRNPRLDFSSLERLQKSLALYPKEEGLVRARTAEDETTLDIAATRPFIRDMASTRDGLARLWNACQLPDYRKVSAHIHADLVMTIFEYIMRQKHIPNDWFQREISLCARLDGDIQTLSGRLAQIRTWTFCANQADWLRDPVHWQNVTHRIEDELSDALHERLTQRFVDRRTAFLMRRLREKTMLDAEVTAAGDVIIEGQHLGMLQGFRFTADPLAEGTEAKALHAAAARALINEIETRAARLHVANDDAFALAQDGLLRWNGQPVAKLQAGEKILEPRLLLLADDALVGAAREQVESRLNAWLKAYIQRLLGPLLMLEQGEGIEGIARGIAFQVAENLGVLERLKILNDMKALDQPSRAKLRSFGIRFGAFHIFIPILLRPAPRSLAIQLFALKQTGEYGVDDLSPLTFTGRTSFAVTEDVSSQAAKDFYRTSGFRLCGKRAVRVDILERLVDIIRPAIAYKPGETQGTAPQGAGEGDGFIVTGDMTSLVGCAGEDFAEILRSLGYTASMRAAPKLPEAPVVAAFVATPEAATSDEASSEAAQVDSTDATAPEAAISEASAIESAATIETIVVADAAPVEASADANVETSETPAEAAADAAPKLVETWHMARFERPKRDFNRNEAGKRNFKPRDGQKEPQLGPDGKPVARPPRREWQNRNPNAAAPADGAAPVDGAPTEGNANSAAKPAWKRDYKAFDRPKRDGEQAGGEKSGGKPNHPRNDGGRKDFSKDRKDGGRNDKGGRKDNRRDDWKKDYAPQTTRSKEIDPNSPFAALMALKEKMSGN